MKTGLLMFLATALIVAALWFFQVSGTLLSGRQYLAGLLHILVGVSATRAGVELARRAVALHVRGRCWARAEGPCRGECGLDVGDGSR